MIKIIDVKVIGLCSKHRKEGDEIPRYKNGDIVTDNNISCLHDVLSQETKEDVGTTSSRTRPDILKIIDEWKKNNLTEKNINELKSQISSELNNYISKDVLREEIDKLTKRIYSEELNEGGIHNEHEYCISKELLIKELKSRLKLENK